MESRLIAYKNSSIHYLQFNGGSELLVCLHGFGERSESFLSLAPALIKQYTIVAIDMPFHGRSVWSEGLDVTIQDVVGIIDNIPVLQQKQFSLMGYSMGGRIALHLYQHLPQRVRQLILLAPDGLKVNGWYWLATQSKYGNRLFQQVMKKPGAFFSGTRLLNKAKLINTGVYNYVHQYLQQESNREALYNIWTAMRNIRPDIPLIKTLINKNRTPVIFIYGAYDRIIRYTTGNRFCKNLEQYCTVHVLRCGHRLLQEKNTQAIAALL